ncbi:MAG: hypothetical protein JXQ99_26835 [Hyphomicrobiaceae bacterium]
MESSSQKTGHPRIESGRSAFGICYLASNRRRIVSPDDSIGGAGDSVRIDGSACREHDSGDSGTNPTGWRKSGSAQNTVCANADRSDNDDRDASAARSCVGQPEVGFAPSVSHDAPALLTCGELCERAAAPSVLPGEFWEHFVESFAPGRLCEQHGEERHCGPRVWSPEKRHVVPSHAAPRL